jgi:hypothetical protein
MSSQSRAKREKQKKLYDERLKARHNVPTLALGGGDDLRAELMTD